MAAGDSVETICARYSLGASPHSLRDEITRNWLHRDPEFRAKYKALARPAGGKKLTKEELNPEEHAGWEMRYCEALYTSGNPYKAASATPYDYQTIYKMLSPAYPDYRKDFAELVQDVRMRFVADMQERVLNVVKDEKTAPKDVAWIAFQWMERQDKANWSRQMVHSGTIEHKAVGPMLSREDRLKALLAEQKQFMLPAGEPAQQEVIDVEVVPESV